MKEDAPTPNPVQVAGLHARALKRTPFLKGRLTLDTFALGVRRSVAHRFRDGRAEPAAVAAYIDSLRVEDLAVAVACEAGDERAWEHVVLEYRPILYRAASVLTRDDAAGRELAATVSRKLSWARKRVRGDVEQLLRDQHQLTPAEIELCYQYMVEDSVVDLSKSLESDE